MKHQKHRTPLRTRAEQDRVKPPTRIFDRLLGRIVPQDDGCWLIDGLDTDDYARIGTSLHTEGWYGKIGAHRVMYETMWGPIPEGHHIHHRCERKHCVRPEHLALREAAVHTQEHFAAATHCKRGHPFTPENTYVYKGKNRNVRRECKTCRREANRRR